MKRGLVHAPESLALVPAQALIAGRERRRRDVAESIKLGMEYDPDPPFRGGSPESAEPGLVAKVRAGAAKRQAERQAAVDAAAARLR